MAGMEHFNASVFQKKSLFAHLLVSLEHSTGKAYLYLTSVELTMCQKLLPRRCLSNVLTSWLPEAANTS